MVIVTRNEDITEPIPLRRRKHGVQDVDRPPIRKEVALLVARPRSLTKIEIVVDVVGEVEVFTDVTQRTCCPNEILWYFSFAELCAHRREETAGLRGWIAGESEGFPNV